MLRRRKQKYINTFLTGILVIILGSEARAQLSVYPRAFGFRFHYGFIYQHKIDMDLLITGHIPAFELFYRFNYHGEKEWEKAHRYPNTGIALEHVRFNNDLVGNAWAIIPYLSFPLHRSGFADLQFRVGTGLGYVTKKFDLQENRKNTIISTHFNSAINFLLQYHFKPVGGMEILTGLSLTHFSNATFKVPNAGVNVVGANLGLTFNLGKPVEVSHYSFPILEKKWRFLVWTGIWAKENDPVNRSKYGVVTLAFNALKRY